VINFYFINCGIQRTDLQSSDSNFFKIMSCSRYFKACPKT
ncbi:hypothetical protein LEP1GSC170_5213, partial [Leptospira interrogans serovar Bataviae str. HAI135]